jgi:hypothetical protein
LEYLIQVRSFIHNTRRCALAVAIATFLLGAAAPLPVAAQKPEHTGTKLEGYATQVTPDSINVFDKKNRELTILTDKDYTSLIKIGAPVTVWYKKESGVYRLKDIVYPQGGVIVPPSPVRERIKRIIVLPRPEGVENCQGLFDAISKYLSDNAGWFVAPPALAQEIASRSKLSSSPLDAIDPDTGQVDMQRYLEPQQYVVMKIAEETESDAVMDVRVIKVKATIRGSVAAWDDMTEPVASRKAHALMPFAGGGNGWVYAATVDMNLWNRTGKLLWKKRRGFAVLGVQSALGGKFRERPLTEVYQDSGAVEKWLEETLGELAPPVNVKPAPPQISPDLQKELEKAKKASEEDK